MEPIKALPLLGVTASNACEYCVRLSKVMPHLDPNEWLRDPSPAARDRLHDHLFGHVWPDTAPGRKHSMKGKFVLQFLQVERGVPVYAFMGAFKVGKIIGPSRPGVRAPLLVYDWRDNEISDLHQYVGKLRVRYVRPAGYCGMDYRLDHQAFAEDMLERMVVEGAS